jgi:hypothetical protein
MYALLAGEARVVKQRGYADDAVERRLYFMGHVRKKDVLGPGRLTAFAADFLELAVECARGLPASRIVASGGAGRRATIRPPGRETVFSIPVHRGPFRSRRNLLTPAYITITIVLEGQRKQQKRCRIRDIIVFVDFSGDFYAQRARLGAAWPNNSVYLLLKTKS